MQPNSSDTCNAYNLFLSLESLNRLAPRIASNLRGQPRGATQLQFSRSLKPYSPATFTRWWHLCSFFLMRLFERMRLGGSMEGRFNDGLSPRRTLLKILDLGVDHRAFHQRLGMCATGKAVRRSGESARLVANPPGSERHREGAFDLRSIDPYGKKPLKSF